MRFLEPNNAVPHVSKILNYAVIMRRKFEIMRRKCEIMRRKFEIMRSIFWSYLFILEHTISETCLLKSCDLISGSCEVGRTMHFWCKVTWDHVNTCLTPVQYWCQGSSGSNHRQYINAHYSRIHYTLIVIRQNNYNGSSCNYLLVRVNTSWSVNHV